MIARASTPIDLRKRFFLGLLFAGGCCFALAILFGNLKDFPQSKPVSISEADPIIDIWINKMLGYFFVFLPDHTARLYESYSFELTGVGQWRRVEDRAIYPESPKVDLPSYKVEFENDRLVDVFLYPIAHHSSIAIEDRIIGHRGYNRLSDVDDPNGFYRQKFARGLSSDLSIVNSYWQAHHGRPGH